MRDAITIARYKFLNSLNMFRSKGLLVTILSFAFLYGGLIIGCFFLASYKDTVSLTRTDLINWLTIIIGIFFIISIFRGLEGYGIGSSSRDRDCIFPSPVKPREYFIATQMSSMLMATVFFLPMILIGLFIILPLLDIPLSRCIPMALGIIIFLNLVNIIAALMTMLLVFSKRAIVIILSVLSISISILFLSFYAVDAVWILINALPNTLAAEMVVSSISKTGSVWYPLLGLFLWYVPLFLTALALSRFQYYTVKQPQKKKSKRGHTRGLPISGKDVRGALVQKELLSLWRTKTIFIPLRYSFIFFIPFIYRYLPTELVQYSTSTIFETMMITIIIFMLMSISGMVQRWYSKELKMMWIQRSLPISSKCIIDGIVCAVTIAGIFYVVVISLILTHFFGHEVFYYLPLIAATGIISANFGVYSNTIAPITEELSISPSFFFLIFLSIILSGPCILPVIIPSFIRSIEENIGLPFGLSFEFGHLWILVSSILVLIYTIIVILILRRMTARKFDDYELNW
jgi:hypothetical protein